MTTPTPTPEQLALALQARRASLMRIWATGSRRLSVEERAEIADIIGGTGDAPPAETGFALDPTAPLPAKLRDYYRFTYAQYATGEAGAPNYQNSRDGRTVKRWVSAGRKRTPPDLPPLDEPAKMAAWFRRNFPKEPPPPVLLSYESSAPTISAALPGETAVPPAEVPAAAAQMAMKRFDFTVDVDEGQSLRRARIIEAANGEQVAKAAESGDEDAYRKWFPIWQQSANVLRQLEKEDRAARKELGELISRGPVLTETAQLIEALRIMHELMPDRVLAELEKSDHSRLRRVLKLLKPALLEAVHNVRENEVALFMNLESVRSPADLRAKLEAAA